MSKTLSPRVARVKQNVKGSEKACLFCKQTFRIKRRDQEYCSRECRRGKFHCPRCHKPGNKDKLYGFCSVACLSEDRPELMQCISCGAQLNRPFPVACSKKCEAKRVATRERVKRWFRSMEGESEDDAKWRRRSWIQRGRARNMDDDPEYEEDIYREQGPIPGGDHSHRLDQPEGEDKEQSSSDSSSEREHILPGAK